MERSSNTGQPDPTYVQPEETNTTIGLQNLVQTGVEPRQDKMAEPIDLSKGQSRCSGDDLAGVTVTGRVREIRQALVLYLRGNGHGKCVSSLRGKSIRTA